MTGRDSIEVELTADELVAALLSLAPERGACVLDSCGARGDGARFLIAGFDPFETIEARGRELHVRARGDASWRVETGSVLALLDARMASQRLSQDSSAEIPTRGACFAAFSYDLARRFEDMKLRAPSPSAHTKDPDAVLAFFNVLFIHDYARGTTRVVGEGAKRLEEARAVLLAATARASNTTRTEQAFAASNFTRAEYVAAVEKIKEHICAGDIYQANLTQQITCPPRVGVTPERVFARLRREHPAAFAAFVRLPGGGAIVSASPERFVRVCVDEGDAEGALRVVEAWPIKGTRRRGRDAAEDERLRAELLSSAKDRAENVMIVDLLRNDLGRVSRYGSIEVAELCALQEHPTLFHLVSKVRGRLREGVTAGALLRAAFPCGSITGAPKIRAMQIIDAIETTPRGFSMGALGYFSFDGAMDLNVAIRTLTFDADGAARFNVGGGIVAESDPSAEYDESLLKAHALLRALDAQLRTED